MVPMFAMAMAPREGAFLEKSGATEILGASTRAFLATSDHHAGAGGGPRLELGSGIGGGSAGMTGFEEVMILLRFMGENRGTYRELCV